MKTINPRFLYSKTKPDPIGNAYGAALAADGETLDFGYPDENILFRTLRNNGTLPLVKELMIRGWSSDDANAREAINGGLGEWIGSGRTRDAVNGYVTYSGNSAGRTRQTLATLGATANSWGVIAEIIHPADYAATANYACLFFGSNPAATSRIGIYHLGGDLYGMFGANAEYSLGAMPASGGFICMTRTGANDVAVYYLTYAGVFSTLYSSAAVAGGVSPATKMGTGAQDTDGTATDFVNDQERSVTITSGLSAANAELIMDALLTYKDAKGWTE